MTMTSCPGCADPTAPCPLHPEHLPPQLPMCDPAQPNSASPWPHDYEDVGEEYGSLAEGGSYTILQCRRCDRRAYRQLPD